MKDIRLTIKRQNGPEAEPYFEKFIIPYRKNMNVIILLQEIQRNPVKADGQATLPIIWECNCLEEVCGACTMIINGRPCQACSALVDKLKQPITLAPLTKFPVIRDLMVDRSVLFNSLKKIKAWIPIDGTYPLGPGPRIAPKIQEEMYPLSRCMSCGCCMEGCPNVNDRSAFMGPAVMSQVQLFNTHPTGAMHKEDRLKAVMSEEGVAGCGNSQNCVRLCPKEIPLTTSLANLNREVNRFALFQLQNK